MLIYYISRFAQNSGLVTIEKEEICKKKKRSVFKKELIFIINVQL